MVIRLLIQTSIIIPMITYFAMNLVSRFPRSTTHNTMMYVTKKLLGKGNELSIHKLKHTHATLLLESNVPMKVIQERLGHKSEAITSDVYSHVTKK